MDTAVCYPSVLKASACDETSRKLLLAAVFHSCFKTFVWSMHPEGDTFFAVCQLADTLQDPRAKH